MTTCRETARDLVIILRLLEIGRVDVLDDIEFLLEHKIGHFHFFLEVFRSGAVRVHTTFVSQKYLVVLAVNGDVLDAEVPERARLLVHDRLQDLVRAAEHERGYLHAKVPHFLRRRQHGIWLDLFGYRVGS